MKTAHVTVPVDGTAMTARVIRLRRESGVVAAVIGPKGRIYTPAVWIDSPIRLHKVPNGDIDRYGRDLPAPLKRACNRMLKAGKALGITKGAKDFLRSTREAS